MGQNIRIGWQKFKEYMMSLKRERDERRNSLTVMEGQEREQGFLISNSDIQDVFYPKHLRHREIRIRVCHILVHMSLVSYISLLILAFWDSWRIDCIRQLNEWLSTYLVLEILHLVERIVSLCLWLRSEDPYLQEARTYIFGRIWINLVEAAWIIYGSSFIYSQELKECDLRPW